MTTLDMREQGNTNENEEGKEILEEENQDVEETTEDSSPSTKSDEEDEDDSEEAEATTPDEEPKEKSEDSPSEPSPEPVDDKEPYDVNGLLTEKDKILADIVELRKERRSLKEAPPEPLLIDKEEDLSDIAPSDVALIEKVLKSKGYVQKGEIQATSYKEKINSLKDQWLERHPEYKPENDPEDKRWNALNSEMNFFKPPTKPEDILKLLDRADAVVSPKKSIPTKSSAAVTASQEKIKVSSKGTAGGASTKTSKPESSLKGLKGHMKGFTDEEIDEILS